jgi:hypothetical protein
MIRFIGEREIRWAMADGDYVESYEDASGKWVSYKGNYYADYQAMIYWLTPEEVDRVAANQQSLEEAHKALKSLRHKVLARELPDWELTAEQDPVSLERDATALETAKKLMQPEEESQHEELMKRFLEFFTIREDFRELAMKRKGGPLVSEADAVGLASWFFSACLDRYHGRLNAH